MKLINKAHTLDLFLRVLTILVAFLIVSTGTIFMLEANLGMNPWGTLALGISKLTHISYGQANQLIGLAVLLLMAIFKVYPGLGIGPRESIVMALVKKTNQGFAKVKTTIESIVFVLGVLLGGDFGIGTILITLLTGRLMESIFAFHKFDVKAKEHLDLKRTLNYIRA